MKFSLEELDYHYKNVLKLTKGGFEGMSAFDTTQYLSGSLFVFTDNLLGETYSSPEHIEKVEVFLKAVMRMIVVWMD